MLKVGITGGIGAGKTTVARIFSALGIPVFYSDDEAKKCYSSNPEVRQKIRYLIGSDAYDTNEKPNFQVIAKRIFTDEAILNQVNSLIHPLVAHRFEQWCSENQQTKYVLKEAAILIETGAHKSLDALVLVVAPERLRIERVMKRTQENREAVEARIRQQGSVDEALKLADYCILNDEKEALIPHVLSIHAQLIERSNTHQ